MLRDERKDSYITAEISQAWTHYRHMEEMRTKYLSFYSTVIIASAGFFVNLAKDERDIVTPHLFFPLSIFTLLLFVFSLAVWANIYRIGHIVWVYGNILQETRKSVLKETNPAYVRWQVRKHIPPSVSGGLFSIQSAASYIVSGVCLVLTGMQVVLTMKAYDLGTLPVWQKMGGEVFIFIEVVLSFYALYCVAAAKKFKKTN
ncbi:hypothetical protein [Silvimonas amylolytica]|uniref:DUF3278 domain-containing protein n=1 Tax=Silvimonas amylolytica TaxID=449663 RepID=A0ABQ2PH51_9NEIS|nr:hypothetical protein [Silvimonas amylolytica]GGP24701.1 hypothetical protein GCM10010971_05200 [Silvimonas amylolytica]